MDAIETINHIDKLAEQSEIDRLKAVNAELLEALRALQDAIRDAHLLDVKKHFSLCVADSAACKAIWRAEGR